MKFMKYYVRAWSSFFFLLRERGGEGRRKEGREEWSYWLQIYNFHNDVDHEASEYTEHVNH